MANFNTGENHPRSRPVRQYSLGGRFIARYPSIGEACRNTGASTAGIWMSCNNYRGQTTSGGYVWKYDRKRRGSK